MGIAKTRGQEGHKHRSERMHREDEGTGVEGYKLYLYMSRTMCNLGSRVQADPDKVQADPEVYIAVLL